MNNIAKQYYQAFSISLQNYDKQNAWGYIFGLIQSHTENEFIEYELKQEIAKKRVNESRNRYLNVLPFDQTRVTITPSLSNPDGYINSSIVNVEEAKRKYILCQGPLEDTCADFWQMIWEQECLAIVMLNKLIEGGAWKCHDYFPSSEENEQVYGNWKVVLKEEKNFNAFVHRTIELQNLTSKETRTIHHIQYTSWPDFGVPPSSKCFLDLLKYVRDLNVLSNSMDDPPCVVHCSAGIGRSGSFVFVDSLLQRIELNADMDFAPPEHLLKLRRQRVGLIQTPQQLRFAWIAVIDAIEDTYGLTQEDLEEEEAETSNNDEEVKEEKASSAEATPEKLGDEEKEKRVQKVEQKEEVVISTKGGKKTEIGETNEIESARAKRREMISKMVEKSRATEEGPKSSIITSSNLKVTCSIGAAVAVAFAAYYFSKST